MASVYTYLRSRRWAAVLAVYILHIPIPAYAYPSTGASCPAIDLKGISKGMDGKDVEERIWWVSSDNAYYIQGPQLAMRFSYPNDPGDPSELQHDLKHIYKIVVDDPSPIGRKDFCNVEQKMVAHCEMVREKHAGKDVPALIVERRGGGSDRCHDSANNLVKVEDSFFQMGITFFTTDGSSFRDTTYETDVKPGGNVVYLGPQVTM